MLLGFLRFAVLAGVLVPVIASAQPDAPRCDLAYSPSTKIHLSFSAPGNPELSDIVATGFAHPVKNADVFGMALALARDKQDKCGEALAEYGLAAAMDR